MARASCPGWTRPTSTRWSLDSARDKGRAWTELARAQPALNPVYPRFVFWHIARLLGSRLAADLAAGLERAEALQAEAVPDETCRRLKRRLEEGDWYFTTGQILHRRMALRPSDYIDHSYIEFPLVVYGWRQHDGRVKVHRLDRSLKLGRIDPGSEVELLRLMPTSTEARFFVAYQRGSSSHGLFHLPGEDRYLKMVARQAAATPGDAPARGLHPEPKAAPRTNGPARVTLDEHPAKALAPYASSAAARETLDFLLTTEPKEAWWWMVDLLTRRALPDSLDAEDEDGALHRIASELRGLAQIPESRAEAVELIGTVASASSRELTSILNPLLAALRAPGPRDGRASLDQLLVGWPPVGSSVKDGRDSGAQTAVDAVLETISRSRRQLPTTLARTSQMWQLVIETDRAETRRVLARTGQPIIIGRASDCDVVLDRVGTVTRHHCELTVDKTGKLTLRDLGHSGGTYIGSQRIGSPSTLTPGDRVQMGRVAFWVTAEPLAVHPV